MLNCLPNSAISKCLHRAQLSLADTPDESFSAGAAERALARAVPKAERTVPYSPAEWEDFKKVCALPPGG